MKKSLFINLTIWMFVIGVAGVARADLMVTGKIYYDGADRNLVYDNELDITWLDYTDAKTTWENQNTWADNLSLNINGTTYSDWRLPSGEGNSSDWESGSEMGHLYYVEFGFPAVGLLEGVVDNPPPPTTSAMLNSTVFENLIGGYYWTSTEFDPPPTPVALAYYMNEGYLGVWEKDRSWYGIAVHDGRVSVPEPVTILLFGTGIAGLTGTRLRRKKNA